MLRAMADQPRSEVIKQNPIGNGLEGFCASYKSVYNSKSIPYAPDTLDQLDDQGMANRFCCGCSSNCYTDLRKLALSFLSAAQNLVAARLLPTRAGRGTLRSDLLQLDLSLESDDFDLDRIKPLLKAALIDNLDDTLI
jgi:hypothetical protein